MAATNTHSLTVVVTGIDGSPLVNARVTRVALDREHITVTSDARGKARFDASSNDAATVTVIAAGMAPDSREIGGNYPVRLNGVEEFVLGPPGRLGRLQQLSAPSVRRRRRRTTHPVC